jgi:uncharacterized protein
LRHEGFSQLRVRSHGDIARLEVPLDDLPRMLDLETRTRVTTRLHELGYRYVTVDLDGFRSGSMNPVPATAPIPPA